MSNIRIDTDRVVIAANKIRGLNQDIQQDFSEAESAIKKLEKYWEGNAASEAFAKWNSLIDFCRDSRHTVVENYANFMLQQVGEGYTLTEQANTTLADAFK